MSVSDPMIKDLKGSAVHFLGVLQPVTDDTEAVQTFCEALERILLRGLLVRINAFGYWRDPEPWHWLEKLSFKKFGAPYLYQLSVEKVRKCEKVRTNIGRTRLLIRHCLNNRCLHILFDHLAPYLYQLSVEKVRKCEKVRTNTGRTRLLIRHCLNNRCLHIPFQLLLETKQYKLVYGRESVLGSEILAQILMSVVLLPSRLQFKLDTDNSRFLDDAWLLPTVRRLTFVPADQLGISLTFVDGRAVAVEVLPDSVASEDEQIEVGDVLDELNSVVIIAGLQGCMGQVLRKSAGHPITAYVIKAKHKGTLYGPLVPLLRRAGLSTTQVLSGSISSISESKQAMTYMGRVLTADRGDVQEIKQAIRQLLGEHQETVQVLLDCHDMGVTVTQVDNSTVLMKHSYMQISSCGCTVQAPNYFAYIAEDRSISADNRFVCYIFHAENQDLIDNTLTSIGQGFKRTHFAV